MTDQEQREAARQFYYKWRDRGNEDEDAHFYWIDLLSDIFDVDHVTDRLNFEKKVIGPDGNTKRIDVYIPETHVLIEQKSLGVDLSKPQAGHKGMTPFEQAKMYDNGLPYEEKSRWIVVSNFREIWIYDMNEKWPQPVKITLDALPDRYKLLDFLVRHDVKKISQEMQISLEAGRLVGKIYDSLIAQYKNPDSPSSLQSLNKLCVRLVFCLYAEDAGVFKKSQFHDYLAGFDASHTRLALIRLFQTIDIDYDHRDPYLEPELAAFPYVNGGLFADENIEIPNFTDEIREIILDQASSGFNWSKISPTIFGSLFESTLSGATRRSGGMHYTSVENIHKVIDPLFLDDLKLELEEILKNPNSSAKTRQLRSFQEKLGSLVFLDPAAGSGNFLTETYLSLRRLENDVIRELQHDQMVLGEVIDPIKVLISSFYGIEINDFAVSVAKTAMWIAENQMMKETEDIVHMQLDFLPLKTEAHIVEGNALRLDWGEIVDKVRLSYIMGNPPFVGASMMTKTQKDEAVAVFGKGKRINSIDYVGAWYHKAAGFISNSLIRVAFVSTNSITQGEQVAALWSKLLNEYKIHIDFAYRTFVWDNEASDKAHVHCVIIGFSTLRPTVTEKKIYTEGTNYIIAENINPYLIDGPNVLIESRAVSISGTLRMTAGNKPSDGGNLILTEQEREELISKTPSIEQVIRRYIGSQDFINNKPVRYCLWLKDVNPAIYRNNPEIKQRLDKVRAMRLNSTAAPTRAYADKPSLFFSTPQTDRNYLCIPEVSSESRRYIPIGFMDKRIIASNKLLIIPDADIYYFGILTSNVHMAWTRVVCGRMKSDYQYSGAIVYNNFPWPTPTDEQKERISSTAQAILDARALYPDSSLADLYDPNTMPAPLLKAHRANDKAVMDAYGMPIKETDESACVAWLMRLYQEMTGKEAAEEAEKAEKPKRKSRKKTGE